jgi:hypothetical protein
MGDEFRTDNAMEACRRLGLRCEDCLPRAQWCDLCDYRQQVIDVMLRGTDTVHVVTTDGRFAGVFWLRDEAEEYGQRLTAEDQTNHYQRGDAAPWQAPEIRVLEVEVQ